MSDTRRPPCINCGQQLMHVDTFAASITAFDWVHVATSANECHPVTHAAPDWSSHE